MNTNILINLYKQYTGQRHESLEPLTGSGSNRRYYRITGRINLIGVCGESIEENRAFIYMARHFHTKGIPVPEVLAVSDDESCYIQEDLGDTLLFNAIANGRNTGIFSTHEKELIRKSITVLPSKYNSPSINTVQRSRRSGFRKVLSIVGFQPPHSDVGFELFQILLP